MRGLAQIVAAGGCVLMALAASAREVQLGLDATLQGESNVLRTSTDEKADGLVRIGPQLTLREEQQKLAYRLFYNPVFEQFFDVTELSGWNHYLNARGSYGFGPSTEVGIQGSFIQGRSRSLAAIDVGGLTPDEAVEVLERRSLQASLWLTHEFTARLRARLGADFQYYLFETTSGADNRSLGGTASLEYHLSSRTQTGLGGAVTQQVFDGTSLRPESRTTVARIFASYGYAIDPTFSFQVQAGPIVLSSEQVGGLTDIVLRPKYVAGLVNVGTATNPVFELRASGVGQCTTVPPFPGPRALDCRVGAASPPIALSEALTEVYVPFAPGWAAAGPTDRKVTYFANASLRKSWGQTSASLVYERRESASSVEGASTILDSVTLFGQWLVSERWSVGALGLWLRRTSSSTGTSRLDTVMQDNLATGYAEAVSVIATPTFQSLDQTQYRASAWARFMLAKRTALRGSFEYTRQRSEGLSGREWKNFVGFLRLEYRFDPFRF